MRIEVLNTLVAVVLLTAVLCPRLAAANNLTLSFSPRKTREHPFRGHISRRTQTLDDPTKRYREILRQEGGEHGLPVDCCPTVEEMVEPVGGRNRENMYVQLYRDGQNAQRFFEYSCKPEVLDKPCRFIDRKFSNQSRCVQKFSYTYAIVENSGSTGGKEEHGRHRHRERLIPTFAGNTVGGSMWTLDYIKVRSGCSCEVSPKPKKKKKFKKSRPRDQDFDLEP
ncbi:uncharacterized protein LOC117610694 isoform X2 [Osmia lignaria lignaria]|uniref:uncharacterized protein LOC114880641 isoform X2 n=1 Tax=Osmia bicornis bicornis TaxID=1437191 RepID=UPI0010F613AA|nr:uncharacterized protein LOC114880641 isoform X2 [Osmia bicornis bicornis]XP_029052734.1 uncharacterized protein LOC114880641 isoform X2 [Osmia bicornis bicornis]XP_034194257.1 uncharacterized protein LOC117610694 isoform X2 [Osmia lignaria]